MVIGKSEKIAEKVETIANHQVFDFPFLTTILLTVIVAVKSWVYRCQDERFFGIHLDSLMGHRDHRLDIQTLHVRELLIHLTFTISLNSQSLFSQKYFLLKKLLKS